MIEFSEVDFGSAAYEATLALRAAVLRAPLGLELTAADLEGEAQQRHFALTDGERLLACVVIKADGGGRGVTLRQMAVTPEAHGQGLGARLIRQVEALLQADGVAEIGMSARQGAVGFYEKLGYRTVGAGYTSLGIPHIRMAKRLTS